MIPDDKSNPNVRAKELIRVSSTKNTEVKVIKTVKMNNII
jgi:hypothetical protein